MSRTEGIRVDGVLSGTTWRELRVAPPSREDLSGRSTAFTDALFARRRERRGVVSSSLAGLLQGSMLAPEAGHVARAAVGGSVRVLQPKPKGRRTMDWTISRVGTWVATALLIAGCGARAVGGGGGPVEDASADGPAPAVDAPGAPDAPRPAVDAVAPDVPTTSDAPAASRSYDFVITQITIDEGVGGMAPNPSTHARGVAGFNLDGRFSPPVRPGPEDCAHGDFFSTLDPDQNTGDCAAGLGRGGASCQGGVDNQLPEIAATVRGFGTDVRASFRDQIDTGRLAMVVRVSDVDGEPGPGLDDDRVTVRLYPVARPQFASCSMIGTPGARYAIDDASLEVPGDLDRARATFQGRIVNGRVVVNPPPIGSPANLAFSLPVQGMGLPLPLFQAQLRMTVTADRAADGNLGGYTQLRQLAAMLGTLLPAGIPPATVQTVLMSLVDVQDPAGDPAGCAAPNGGISIGLGFSAVRVTVADATVRGPTPGMCGAI